jgi:hypothetical protein
MVRTQCYAKQSHSHRAYSGTRACHDVSDDRAQRGSELVRPRPIDFTRFEPIRGDQRERLQEIREGALPTGVSVYDSA